MFVKSNEAMELLKVSRTQLFRLIESGKIDAYKSSGALLFDRDSLIKFVKDSKVVPIINTYHSSATASNDKKRKFAKMSDSSLKWV